MKNRSRLYQLGFNASIVLLLLLCTKCNDNSTLIKPKESDLSYLFINKDLQLFGEKLFFDATLSDPVGQSCASCHGPEVGWTGPDERVNKTGSVYPGAIHQRIGNRKPNSAAYATLSPVFHTVIEDGKIQFVGGNFWDGRATGFILGNPAADQAQGPFLNPVEQNISNTKILIEKVCNTDYVSLFNKIGEDIWGIKNISKSNDINLQFGIIGLAIAAFENSDKVNQFSSKFDYYLRGKLNLTDKEKKGLDLFNGKAKCALCHMSALEPDGSFPLFTDYRFENLGLPSNPQNPWYSMDTAFNCDGANWINPGLKDFIKNMPSWSLQRGNRMKSSKY